MMRRATHNLEILLSGEPAIRNLRGDGRHKGTAQRGAICILQGAKMEKRI
jgi:hypothetical protein